MENKLHLDIFTPDRVVFSGYVEYVDIPEVDGLIRVLHGHAPLIAEIGIGIIELKSVEGNVYRYYCEGGFLDVTWEGVSILADIIKEENELDLKEIERRKEELLVKLYSNSPDTDFKALLKEIKSVDCQIELLEKVSK